MTQKSKASSKHATTAACLFETELLTVAGKYLTGDHREGVGDIQKVDDDESELVDDDDEDCPDGRENFEMTFCDGVASSFGDLSTNGSRGGELKSRHTVRSRKPMSQIMEVYDRVSNALQNRLR